MNDNKKGREPGFWGAIWNFFSSMKTAIALLLIFTVFSIAGTVIPQKAAPEAYGDMYALYSKLGLTDVFNSTLYSALLALIGVSLIVCSINRFRSTWKRTFDQKVHSTPERIKNMKRSEVISSSCDISSAEVKVETALRSSSYHIQKEKDGDSVVFLGSKGRLGIWGPYLTHLSILVIFIGAILGNRLGFEGVTLIVEGQKTDVYFQRNTGKEKPLGFEVGLREFTIEADERSNPTAYKSDLAVYKNDELVAEKVIAVNHPLNYHGVIFYQTNYGLDGLTVSVTSPEGETIKFTYAVHTQDIAGGKRYHIHGEGFREAEIDGEILTFYAHNLVPNYIGGEGLNRGFMPLNPAVMLMVNDRFHEYKGLDAWTTLGWIDQNTKVEYKGFTITLDNAIDYTVLQVAQNPGLPVIYAGFGLMMLGIFMSFYITHRTIRVRISANEDDVEITAGGTSRNDPWVFDYDLERLRK